VPEQQQPPNSSAPRDASSLAPPWHTAALIAVICAVATTGALLTSRGGRPPQLANPSSRIAAVYLPMVVVQWSLAIYVCRVGRPRSALRCLLGKTWRTFGRAFTDLALALSGWLFVKAVELAWIRLFGLHDGTAVLAMLPRSSSERVAWVAVSASAGFCEELVYRGYLQTQLTAFTGRPAVAIAIQAALFAIAHGDQGSGAVARLSLYGLAFGVVAWWRRSLVAGIICHVWTDVASGLLQG
jgi:membrane protease YdiL (CAAX protease family)